MATTKYTVNPNKSFMVVIKGPDANAGFSFTLFNSIGVIVPIIEESITTPKREIPTVRAKKN